MILTGYPESKTAERPAMSPSSLASVKGVIRYDRLNCRRHDPDLVCADSPDTDIAQVFGNAEGAGGGHGLG